MCFLMLSIISPDLLGKRVLLQQAQKVMVCDFCWVYFDPFCVFLCFILIVLMIDSSEKHIYEGGF